MPGSTKLSIRWELHPCKKITEWACLKGPCNNFFLPFLFLEASPVICYIYSITIAEKKGKKITNESNSIQIYLHEMCTMQEKKCTLSVSEFLLEHCANFVSNNIGISLLLIELRTCLCF